MKPIELKLAKGLYLELSRIGYPDEGIRMIVFDNIPYKFHVELQLSRRDTQQLIGELQKILDDKNQENLPH
jgi:hypothetical protein